VNIPVVLLAAGASSRFGRPKLLLPHRGSSLLRYIARISLASDASSTIVVLGAYADLLRAELADLDVKIILNPQWATGISSSIHAAIRSLPRDADAVLLTLCDQPLLSTQLLNAIIAEFASSGAPVIASAYADTLGAPALFSRSLFAELSGLRGDSGAKQLIHAHLDEVRRVSFPEGALDIDTESDRSGLPG